MAKHVEDLRAADEAVREEVELLRRVAAGDEAAFARLYDRFARPLFAVAMRILREVTAAEDMLQDVFVQIWERAAQYDVSSGKPFTWLVVLTRNKCIDRLRARQRREKLGETMLELEAAQPAAAPGGPPELMDLNEQVATMRQALAELRAEQRHALELAFLHGLTQTEIAAHLAVPLGTVKARIRRGMLQLRARLERGPEPDHGLARN